MSASRSTMRGEIGSPVRRIEDHRFLTGQGRFADDVRFPDMAHAHVVRSTHAHARIVRIDKTKAIAAPGVLAVLTGQDAIVEKVRGMKCQSLPDLARGAQHYRPLRPVLATGVVRHVGDGVALIVAETLWQAMDAGELLNIEYEP